MAHANHRPAGVDLTHAGAGTALAILGLSAVIPGLLPAIVLIAAITVVLVVPLLALGLLIAVVLAPPAGIWLAVRRRRSRCHPETRSPQGLTAIRPAPSSHPPIA